MLLHRGYPIEQLAEHASYVETAYSLLYGELPNKQQLSDFDAHLDEQALLHEQIRNFFNGFRARYPHDGDSLRDGRGTFRILFGWDRHLPFPPRVIFQPAVIAKIPTIAAWAYRYTQGETFIYPKSNFGFAENFLSMMFARPDRKYVIKPVLARALDRIFILHADHEQNASTSTVRLVGSTGANPFACIAAGIAALWGPAHGGANEAVLSMLTAIGEKKISLNLLSR